MDDFVQGFSLRLRHFFSWLWNVEGTSGQRARGFAVGIFSGCFPFFGLQTLLALVLASIVRGNHLLAVTGTWISNPFTYIPLYWLNYKVGSLFLGPLATSPGLVDLNRQELFAHGWMLSYRLFLGSTLVGLILGSCIGSVLYFFLKKKHLSKSRL